MYFLGKASVEITIDQHIPSVIPLKIKMWIALVTSLSSI